MVLELAHFSLYDKIYQKQILKKRFKPKEIIDLIKDLSEGLHHM